MALFFVIQGNDQGRRFEVPETTTTIGRDPSNDIQLRDAEVSRRHAAVVFSENNFRLVDNGSANGVYVNDIPQKECILNNGDRISLGETLLLFAQNSSSDSSQSDFLDSPPPKQETPLQNNTTDTLSADVSTDVFLNQFPSLSELKRNPQAAAHLKIMYHTSLVTSQSLEIGTLLHNILNLVAEKFEIDRGCIQIYDTDPLQLITKAIYPLPLETTKPISFTVNPAIIKKVTTQRIGIMETETQQENGQEVVRDFICVPMLGRYGLVGIFYIDALHCPDSNEKGTPSAFIKSSSKLKPDRSLMVAIAHQAALAVEDTRYYKGMIQAERLAVVGQTVSTLSHHIKNILQGISGGSYLIKTGLSNHNEDLIQQGWDIVEKNQNRISKLIHDMLTFSKEREPAYELGNIVETVADVVELMQSRAKEEKIEIRFKAETAIPKFFFDSEQIYHAVANIITNGIDAAKLPPLPKPTDFVDAGLETHILMPIVTDQKQQQGCVQIQVNFDTQRSIAVITVDDNGPGIPISERKNLFRAFYSQKKGRGTGLGLSVAHKVVQEHGGAIRIDDSPLGGARFEIELPLKLDSRSDLL